MEVLVVLPHFGYCLLQSGMSFLLYMPWDVKFNNIPDLCSLPGQNEVKPPTLPF